MFIRHRKYPRQRGAAIIEMALTMPLLLVFLFGIINFGIALYNKAVITNASREAARAGIVFSSDAIDYGAVEAVAENYCANRLITFGADDSVTATAGDADAETLRVQVSYNFQSIAGELVPGMSGLLTLSAETLMKYEISGT